jgi:PKD repeat protein
MKKNNLFQKVLLGCGIAAVAIMTSCKKDAPVPKADFTSEVNNLEVTFTNTSTDASTYEWDFGDSQTSTEVSPVHSYADYGTYTVTLKATGDGGNNTVSYDVELPVVEPITADGIFDDWSAISSLCSYPDGEGRTLLELKVTDSRDFLYFYIKGTSSIGEVIQLYIDADNNAETGWGYWNWFNTPGIEYLMEAVVVGWTGADPGSVIKTATGPDINWPWEDFITQNGIFASSGFVVSGSNKIIEFSILKSLLTTPELAGTIRFVLGNSDNTWANVGSLPPKETGADPVSYTMLH